MVAFRSHGLEDTPILLVYTNATRASTVKGQTQSPTTEAVVGLWRSAAFGYLKWIVKPAWIGTTLAALVARRRPSTQKEALGPSWTTSPSAPV